MQLKYSNTIKNRIITVELETVNFNHREKLALEKFGEPQVKLEKIYKGTFPVSVDRKIRTGFKVRIKFDGTKEVEKAAEAATEFFEEIQEKLADHMRDLIDKLDELEIGFESKNGFADIKY